MDRGARRATVHRLAIESDTSQRRNSNNYKLPHHSSPHLYNTLSPALACPHGSWRYCARSILHSKNQVTISWRCKSYARGLLPGGRWSGDRRAVAIQENPAGEVLYKASKDPLLSPQKGHLSPKLTSLKNPTCSEQTVARSSDSSPPSVSRAGAEPAQNVTGPRLSAPKRVPPLGDRDAGGRSLPFLSLSRPAQSSFILQAGSGISPASHSSTANPPDALSPAWPETGARIQARALTPPPRTWHPPSPGAEKPAGSYGPKPQARSWSLAGPRTHFAGSC